MVLLLGPGEGVLESVDGFAGGLANAAELLFDVATVIAPWNTLVRSRSRRISGALSAIDLTPRQFSQFSPDPHRRHGNSEAAAPGPGS